MKLTKRQKFLAAAKYPTNGGYSTKEEVRAAKSIARGHYWKQPNIEQYCAYSPTGRRAYFWHSWFSWATPKAKHREIKEARTSARLWAQGRYKEIISFANYESNDK